MSTSTAFVCTMSGGKPKWSRYTFPFAVEAFALLGDALYLRHGDTVSVISERATADEVAGAPVAFTATVQTPWLDMGQPGVSKRLEGFDVVGSGAPSVSVGWDQRDGAAFTPPWAAPADTVPGDIIPLPVTGPSFSLRLTYSSAPWSLQSATLYVHDQRPTT